MTRLIDESFYEGSMLRAYRKGVKALCHGDPYRNPYKQVALKFAWDEGFKDAEGELDGE